MIIQMVKSLTAREIFRRAPDVKQKVWDGEYWSDVYYNQHSGTTGKLRDEPDIREITRKGR